MTVPLDRLYHFLDDVVNRDIIIYRWFPHGSKLLSDLQQLKNYDRLKKYINPIAVYHDQEPLNYFLYSEQEQFDAVCNAKISNCQDPKDHEPIREYHRLHKLHLNYIQEITGSVLNIHNNYLLVHSEKNSQEIDHYIRFGAVPVYYFSHALISRDWFRYAEMDPLLKQKNIQKDFLIYQRAWSGTREYRLKFLQLLIDHHLVDHCWSKFNPVNEEHVHYSMHNYRNSNFNVTRWDLENYFPVNTAPSCASADYNNSDYNYTAIEVVLETLFDDSRWHLTEKIFRPIACGQPFLLASTPGSLEYLKSYGFQTFADHIDESYDSISDPVERLCAIIQVMKDIAALDAGAKKSLFVDLQKIADYNQQWFFSKDFRQNIVDEYVTNINNGLEILNQNRGACRLRWKLLRDKGKDKFLLNEQDYQELLSRI
jgi:hypothetical protein